MASDSTDNRLARRSFLRQATAFAGMTASGLWSPLVGRAEEVRPVVVGVMGLSRGQSLAEQFAATPHVEVRYLCDVDSRRTSSSIAELLKTRGVTAQPVDDFRRMLDDPSLDALVCAAPNHWHAPATIHACQAGKHVYVEKPCSHNPWEGEAMVEVARRHQKAVQIGTQRRSSPGTKIAMQRLHSGAIGRVYLARARYAASRGSIGKGQPTVVPSELNYDLWQGPAPRRDYVDNLVHYQWHWRWHWGNGELGNNGIHSLDLCRWGLQVAHPLHVTSSGGRFAFEDDQETPDTQTVCFTFPDNREITWQGTSCNPHEKGFVTFYGTEGTLELEVDGTFKILDRDGKVSERGEQRDEGLALHIANFVDVVRHQTPESLNGTIAEGHRSTLLCHLGNIAQRVSRTLRCRPEDGHIEGDEEAIGYWKREYAPGWEPRIA